MIAEHTFITTLDAPDALAAAAAILQPLRFSLDPTAQPAAPRWLRTPRSARQARSWRNCAAQVHLDFDRGRIAAAIAITTNNRFDKYYRDYALSLATALELAATGRQDPAQALAEPTRCDQSLRRKDIRATIAVSFVLATALTMVGLLIYASATA